MAERLIEIINDQASRLFTNTEYASEYVDDALLSKMICKWPLWRQLYHMLHSMDQWFINPFDYRDHRPDGFTIAALNAEIEMAPLRKTELTEYYDSIRAKVKAHLSNLTVESLTEYPPDCKFTRFDLLLGQFRHIMFHIGMIRGCMLMERDEIPNYMGLSAPIKPVA